MIWTRPTTRSTTSRRRKGRRGLVGVGGRSLDCLESLKPTPASRTTFFATSPFALLESSELRVGTPRGGPFHAKEMGTTTTACGQPSLSWPKLWEVPFSKAMGSVCSACVVAVERRRRQRAIARRPSPDVNVECCEPRARSEQLVG